MNTLGKRIAYARQQREMSQAELGKAIGVSQTAIYLLETRKASGSSHVYALAQALGVNVTWLATGKGPIYVPDAARHATAMLNLLKRTQQLAFETYAEGGPFGELAADITKLLEKIEG